VRISYSLTTVNWWQFSTIYLKNINTTTIPLLIITKTNMKWIVQNYTVLISPIIAKYFSKTKWYIESMSYIKIRLLLLFW